ncbi:hypothetical protein NM688_g2847 [Phlebia brevispora]|uniref:Uncharacterized protein n=1 Tax=Phlebia brevispora TaxID=194682 RepID=A0ACC1T7J3_9APHY|nr:hypothetical protein NM688_g2847 [Phlebia brevispora]
MGPRVWFITGTSSGFGRSTAEYALAQGDIVVATLRKPEVLDDLKAQYSADKLLVVKLDVSKPQEVRNAFQKAKDAFGRLDIVFNNAGYGVLAEVEGSADDTVRKMFEVDFWGAANVNREAVEFFRSVNSPVGGRLIITSSVVGVRPQPLIGYYTAAKHALEGLTQALAIELDPEWNIKITMIEPGGFMTRGINNVAICPPHPAYTKLTLPTVGTRKLLTDEHLKLPNDLDKGVEKIYELSKLENPPLRLPLGKDSIGAIKAQIEEIASEVEKYESWSNELAVTEAKN